MSFSLAEATQKALADAPDVRARIERELTAAFSGPREPRYGNCASWAEPGVDPNRPDLAIGAGGSGEIDAHERELIAADAQHAFARQLRALDQKDLDVPDVRAAPTLVRAWNAIRAEHDAGRITLDEALARGRELFTNWYPRLEDAAELYRVECLQCHGVEGGGDGPTSRFLEPRPRDFRFGIFKYTALKDHSHPRRADLLRTLEQGVDGTSMPNFARLALVEREGLADYVRFLSLRGEVEQRLVKTWTDDGEISDKALVEECATVWERWRKASTKVVAWEGAVPRATPELVARGDALFHDEKKGKCASCHGDHGRGDGPAAWKMGVSGKKEPAYTDDWGNPILPRNLELGIFRGGSRPIDLYRRIYAGIPGGPMPAMGEAKNADETLMFAGDDIWALVHYVRSLSSPELAKRAEK